MDLSNLITMDKDDAAAKADEYRTIKMPSDEDKRIAAIFTALAFGKRIIDLAQAVRDAGRDEEGRPRLAAGLVYRPWCYLYNHRDRAEFRSTNTGRPNFETIEVRDMPGGDWNNGSSMWRPMRTQTPIVPPQHRRWGSKKWTILWEVEQWAAAPLPPGDPILLKPLLGSLYTVEAHWDLTEVERLVLAQRP